MKKRIFAFLLTLAVLLATAGFAVAEPAAKNLIVRFDAEVSLDRVEGELHGLGIQGRKLGIINGMAFKGSERAVQALSRRFEIVAVQEEVVYQASPKPTYPPGRPPEPDPPDDPPVPTDDQIDWGVLELRADEVWGSYTGSGVKVAVLDTGIDTDHEDLIVAGGKSFDPRTTSFDDNNGHGTHVAGTIAARDNGVGVVGVAPEASLYAVKVLNKQGRGYTSNIILGIEWCLANDIDVANMSLGSDYPDPAYEAALVKAMNAGVIVVAAAGNDRYDVDYPGAYPSTIAVAAIDSDRSIASFSSQGPEVDVAAPGVAIYSTYYGNAYETMNGTSMASPHVAGLAALYRQKNRDADLDDFRIALMNASVDLGPAGFDPAFGYGLVDAMQLLDLE